ncbi:hypothetical protein FVE85_6344 [Porphyridium purpureum]|uniref:Uncharacterized protein n=1 Tax=Porphyridium purpureum TaxID=35688 RepID=A0A5J4Z453_PORPP|nr:hypothetical protein FVE85_6344 [Porphyridium purpureum]|eukprot:POR2480..scf295_1
MQLRFRHASWDGQVRSGGLVCRIRIPLEAEAMARCERAKWCALVTQGVDLSGAECNEEHVSARSSERLQQEIRYDGVSEVGQKGSRVGELRLENVDGIL